jgi:hypothetical protein
MNPNPQSEGRADMLALLFDSSSEWLPATPSDRSTLSPSALFRAERDHR